MIFEMIFMCFLIFFHVFFIFLLGGKSVFASVDLTSSGACPPPGDVLPPEIYDLSSDPVWPGKSQESSLSAPKRKDPHYHIQTKNNKHLQYK